MRKMVIALLLCLLCCLTMAQKNITVSNAKELLQAIGPQQTITLEAGDYYLKDAYEVKNDFIVFTNEYDGPELVLTNISGMTLVAEGKVTILAEPRYAWVINFTGCSNITLKGIVFGHTEAGYCSGGVLGFSNCKGFTISNCELYGSGTEGMAFSESSDFNISNCEIRQCTYDIMNISGSQNISFTNCTFKDTGEFDLISITSCSNIFYKKCMFSNNATCEFMPYFFNIDEHSKNISVEHSMFRDNKVLKFVNVKSRLVMKKNKFAKNDF
jgi:pectate lyase